MRKSGIEMLRLLAMFFVVTLHVLGAGGILGSVAKGSKTYYALWLIEIVAYVAVDLFALVSGYVMYNKKMTVKKFFNFYFRVFFYTLIIWGVTRLIGWHQASVQTMLSMSLPHNVCLWYVYRYLPLMILVPVFNLFLQQTDKQKLFGYIIVLFIGFVLAPFLLGEDFCNLSNGYSLIWLCVLYLIGGITAKLGIDEMLSRKKWCFYWIISVLFIWGSKIIMEHVANYAAEEYEEYNALVTYVSPTMVISAFCLFCTFSTVKVDMPKWFYVASGASFGVYLVHMHYFLLGKYITNKFVVYAQWSVASMFIRVICSVIGIFIGSLLVSIVLGFLYDKIWLLINKLLERRKSVKR